MSNKSENKKNVNNESEYNIILKVLSISLLITIVLVVWHVISALNAVQVSSHVDICYANQTVSELSKLQHKVIDSSTITFLTTLLVALFITLGIALINKYEERFHKYTATIKDIDEKHQNLIKETEFLKLIDRLFPRIISIYLLSNLTGNGVKVIDPSKKNEIIDSVCYKIERHISSNKSNFDKLMQSGIDEENKEIFSNYLGDTVDNLESYMKQHNLNSDYAQYTINNIWNIRNQINELKPVDFIEKPK